MTSFAITCCYLEQHDEIYKIFSEIGIQLLEDGIELIVVGNWTEPPDYPGFHAVVLPFLLSEQGRDYYNFYAASKLPMSIDADAEFAAIDQQWGPSAQGLEFNYFLQRAVAFWQTIFEILSPVAVLPWGVTAPVSRVMLRMAQIRQIPAYIIERGYLEDTVMLSASGQTALSPSTYAPDLVLKAKDLAYPKKDWERIKTYYSIKESDRYQQNNILISEDRLHQFANLNGPVFLYIGSNDRGSGLSFHHHALGEKNSPAFESSKEALEEVCVCLKRVYPDCTLIYKPHPATKFEIEADDLTIINASDVKLTQLIDYADVVINLSSGSQFHTILQEKPLVTLANSFLTGRSVAYEVHTLDDIETQLSLAVTRTGLEERLARGRALMVQLYDRYLYGTKPTTPTRLFTSDITEVIKRYKNYVPKKDQKFVNNIDEFRAFLDGSYSKNSWKYREDYLNSIIQIGHEERDELRRTNQNLREEADRLFEEQKQYAVQKATLSEEIEVLKRSLAESDGEHDARIQDLHTQRSTLESQLVLLNETLAAENDLAAERIRQADQNVAVAQAESAKLAADIEDLARQKAAEKEKLADEIDQLTKQHTGELAKLAEEIGELTKQHIVEITTLKQGFHDTLAEVNGRLMQTLEKYKELEQHAKNTDHILDMYRLGSPTQYAIWGTLRSKRP
ncbi:hypothetical protein [Asticcacaulis sp. AC466]|uniref:hypothetical protein n=1 Tax=Asticcacaulis sp. AC466 TaxID=1282362 RepID=UPI00040CAE95|nr:hypothetical protein [Asticcacaulis sp. AC466]